MVLAARVPHLRQQDAEDLKKIAAGEAVIPGATSATSSFAVQYEPVWSATVALSVRFEMVVAGPTIQDTEMRPVVEIGTSGGHRSVEASLVLTDLLQQVNGVAALVLAVLMRERIRMVLK